jgi:thiamine kinase-like enzyme
MKKYKLINQGRTAEVYDIGNGQILKLFLKSMPLPAIESEYNIANAIKDFNLPIPKFFGKMEYEDRIGLVYENIKGPSMLAIITSRPWKLFSCAKKMAKIHFMINKTKVEGIPYQKDRILFFIDRVDGLSDEVKSIIIKEVQKLKEDYFLCHGDMHPDNILFSLKGPVVIDWMNATIGNPIGDVARTAVILKYSSPPQHLSLFAKILINIFKSIFCNVYIKCYIKLAGVNFKEIYYWELPIAAARLYENGPPEEKKELIRFINNELKNRHLISN